VPIEPRTDAGVRGAGSAESVFISAHVPDDQRDAVAARVIEALESARDPDTGERIIVRALRREDVYDGSELDRIPDILIDFGEHHTWRQTGSRPARSWSGCRRRAAAGGTGATGSCSRSARGDRGRDRGREHRRPGPDGAARDGLAGAGRHGRAAC
jgi:hypothetical protein